MTDVRRSSSIAHVVNIKPGGWILLVVAAAVALHLCRDHEKANQTHSVVLRVTGTHPCEAAVNISGGGWTHVTLPWQGPPFQTHGQESVSLSVEVGLVCAMPPENLACEIELDGRPYRRGRGFAQHSRAQGPVTQIGCFEQIHVGEDNPELPQPSQAIIQAEHSHWEAAHVRALHVEQGNNVQGTDQVVALAMAVLSEREGTDLDVTSRVGALLDRIPQRDRHLPAVQNAVRAREARLAREFGIRPDAGSR